tara:strand:+ start:521 stop:1444 length:924 start_codon:yes stop_codon:yes gene_type:complete
MKNKIIFMGTPEIALVYLKSLVESNQNVAAIFSQPPRKKDRGMTLKESPVHQFAKEKGISIYTPNNLNSNYIIEDLNKLKPDLIVVMGYGLKLPNKVLNIPKLGCINIHVSLLPRWRGAAPIEHAILSGDQDTGVTIFKLVEKMDAGPIIAQESVMIDNQINKEDLTKRLNNVGIKLLKSVLPIIFNQKIDYKTQNDNKATYANKITSDIRRLNFNENVKSVYNKIRAFSPKPGAWFNYKKERIKIIKSNFVKGDFEPSIILNNQLHIGCKFGKICPEIIQKEGKKPLNLENFLRGFTIEVGDKVND